MSEIPEILSEEYYYYAEQLISEWIADGYPPSVAVSSMPGDHKVPFPFLMVRPMDGAKRGFHGLDGGSSLLIPCIQFWHEDGSLLEVRGYPVRWTYDHWDLPKNNCPIPEPAITWAYQQLLGQWAEDGYPCCHRYDVNLQSGGQVWAKVYSHEGHELPSNPPMFPEVFGSYFDKDRWADGVEETWLGSMRFKPTEYNLQIAGLWKKAEEERK